VRGWFLGRLPEGWFVEPPEVVVDREEITVVGTLPPVRGPGAPETGEPPGTAGAGTPSEGGDTGGGADTGGEPGADATADAEAEGSADAVTAMALGRSRRFREETRDARIAVAREAEALFGRKVSWGVVCEGQRVMFTTLSVPVMTRLRQRERRVLDPLVDAGVARSRSDALAWCARLVGQHEEAWLTDLRTALRHVEEVRAQGPRS
jgi:hypothetical protein